jgi:hypothetical protein
MNAKTTRQWPEVRHAVNSLEVVFACLQRVHRGCHNDEIIHLDNHAYKAKGSLYGKETIVIVHREDALCSQSRGDVMVSKPGTLFQSVNAVLQSANETSAIHSVVGHRVVGKLLAGGHTPEGHLTAAFHKGQPS